MDGVKPWQLVVIAVGLLGGLGLLGWQLFGGKAINPPDSLMLIDVTTGQRFIADIGGKKTVILPEKNPETGEYTLLPISKGDEGKWYVKRLNEVSSIPPENLKGVANMETGLAAPSDASPIRLKK